MHRHSFSSDKKHLEKRTLIVVIITVTMMIAEIVFGWLTNSMALLADGWHMGTHALALGLSLAAYVTARKHAQNSNFTFGTWKIEILGAYTSALILGMVGIMMVYASIERILNPLPIHFEQAIIVAVIGLVVNGVCAVVLSSAPHSHTASHNHHKGHEHHGHDHDHHSSKDLNFKSAYLHVIADALTSVFAIGALIGAKYFALTWLDPMMGLVGAALIARWSWALLHESSQILLDHEKNSPLGTEIRTCLESDGDTKVYDLHVWRVSDSSYACIVSLATTRNYSIKEYQKRLAEVHELAHVTIEINDRAPTPA